MASNPRRYVLEFYPTPAMWETGRVSGPGAGRYVSSMYAAKKLFKQMCHRHDGLVHWPRALGYQEEAWDEEAGKYTAAPVFRVTGGPDGGATCTKL